MCFSRQPSANAFVLVFAIRYCAHKKIPKVNKLFLTDSNGFKTFSERIISQPPPNVSHGNSRDWHRFGVPSCAWVSLESWLYHWVEQFITIARCKTITNVILKNTGLSDIYLVGLSTIIPSLVQGWQNRCSRPGNCQTKFLTEVVLPTLHLQSRNASYRLHKSIHTQTLWSKHKRELPKMASKAISEHKISKHFPGRACP